MTETEREVQLRAKARQEMRREFETASLACMRAFEAFQHYTSTLEDEGIEVPEAGQQLEAMYDCGVSFHFILRCIATAPTGTAAAIAVREVLDWSELERCASDGKAHAPDRDATILGLTRLIEGRERQMDGLIESHVENDAETSVETATTGTAGAFRAVRRECDAFVQARDLA